VLPNPWDPGSAIVLEHLGFQAVATTSAGFAFSRGLPDGGVSLEDMLAHFREMSTAISLPVNADFQNCFADDPEGVARNVTACVATGVAGLSIEDSTANPGTPLYEFDLAVERVKGARAAIDASGTNVVLTARCEAFLVGDPDPFRTSIERLSAFAAAGADCLYAPGVTDTEQIAALVKALAPKPINVLVFMKNSQLTVRQLEGLGVRRISVGGALARAAWTGLLTAAKEMVEGGTFTALGPATTFDFNKLFRERF